MEHKFKYFLPGTLTPVVIYIFFIIMPSCSREIPEKNYSSVITYPLNSSYCFLSGYALDNQNKYLYYRYYDFRAYTSTIRKIRLDNWASEGLLVSQDDRFIGKGNLVISGDNHVVTQGLDYATGIMTVRKYRPDLTLSRTDTLPSGFPYNINLLLKYDNSHLYGAYNNEDDTGKAYLRFYKYDNDLNVLDSVTDYSDQYGVVSIGAELIKCQNGDIMVLMENIVLPFNRRECLVERRDKDLNLIWRRIYAPPAGIYIFNVAEAHGNFYLYGYGNNDESRSELIILTYDQAGNMLNKKTFSRGDINEKNEEPIIPTDDGGFLVTALTSEGADALSRKGVIFKLDPNLNIVNSKVFGGLNDVISSGLLRISSDRYLFMYFENSFETDPNNYRMVIRYINANGDYIN